MPSIKLRFRDCELDADGFVLSRAGQRLRLERKPMELLILLAEREGQLVKREEIVEKIWGKDFFFDAENGINNAIRKIRAALNDNAEHPVFVETSLGKGYRFIATVERRSEAATASAVEPVVKPGEPSSFRWKRLWFLALGVAALVAGAFGLNSIRTRIPSPHVPQIRAIAVLPLENLSASPDEQYFADGMTEELITNLAKISSLRVISRTSSMQYRSSHKSLAKIASELNVDAVVEGSVTRSSNRVRVTAQLLDAHNDQHLWAETYERDIRDVLVLQHDVASAIAKQVRATISPVEEVKLSTIKPLDPEAYQLYLEGLFHWNKGTSKSASRSREYFQKAIEREPGYARAWVGLAFAYNLMGDFSRGKEAARRAVALDDTNGEAHAALAFAVLQNDWDWNLAQREFKRAIELDANNANSHHAYSVYLSASRRFDEARAEIQRALELDPLAPLANVNLGMIYWASHDFERAVQQMKRALEIDPNYANAHEALGLIYESAGRYAEAAAEFENYRALSGNTLEFKARAAHLYAVRGRRAEALRLLEELKAAHKPGDRLAYPIAFVYVGLNDKDRALRWLEISYAEHDDDLVDLNDDPPLEPLYPDPRFLDLVRRVGVPNQ